jgi:hypothetical protein
MESPKEPAILSGMCWRSGGGVGHCGCVVWFGGVGHCGCVVWFDFGKLRLCTAIRALCYIAVVRCRTWPRSPPGGQVRRLTVAHRKAVLQHKATAGRPFRQCRIALPARHVAKSRARRLGPKAASAAEAASGTVEKAAARVRARRERGGLRAGGILNPNTCAATARFAGITHKYQLLIVVYFVRLWCSIQSS